MSPDEIRFAEVVVPCANLPATLAFFTERLGFRVAEVFPADDPRSVSIVGHGLRLQLRRDATGDPGVLRLACATPPDGDAELVAPNGTRIELVTASLPMVMPAAEPRFVVTSEQDHPWVVGRAGMRYRDLLPGRFGGRYIASVIAIDEGGPVADYVHYHEIAFQVIACLRGWVRVVYEGQGPPFLMAPGDCVLQPPGIRHQVLESSPGLQVIEVTSPAEHRTVADPTLTLPSESADLRWGGQRFVRHVATTAGWRDCAAAEAPAGVFQAQDTGVGGGSAGAVAVRRLRATDAASMTGDPRPELRLLFGVHGTVDLDVQGCGRTTLGPGASACLPRWLPWSLAAKGDAELWEVCAPA